MEIEVHNALEFDKGAERPNATIAKITIPTDEARKNTRLRHSTDCDAIVSDLQNQPQPIFETLEEFMTVLVESDTSLYPGEGEEQLVDVNMRTLPASLVEQCTLHDIAHVAIEHSSLRNPDRAYLLIDLDDALTAMANQPGE